MITGIFCKAINRIQCDRMSMESISQGPEIRSCIWHQVIWLSTSPEDSRFINRWEKMFLKVNVKNHQNILSNHQSSLREMASLTFITVILKCMILLHVFLKTRRVYSPILFSKSTVLILKGNAIYLLCPVNFKLFKHARDTHS